MPQRVSRETNVLDSEWLSKVCMSAGLILNDTQLCKLRDYVKELLSWNKKINLISRKDEQNIWYSHILHSISPIIHAKFQEQSNIVDIGAGGGLPAVPLKIMFPEISIVCIESVSKKCFALKNIIANLELKNMEVICERAEKLILSIDFREKFDYGVARAVTTLDILTKWTFPFLKKQKSELTFTNHNEGGKFFINPPALIAYKGGNIEEELKKAKRKFKHSRFDVIDLSISYNNVSLLVDKKIVVVYF